jgi:alpha-glucosidase
MVHKIGRAIRAAVKEENQAAYLLGEHFFDGTPQLQGDELDATMNYQGFTFPVWRWLAGYDGMAHRDWGDTHQLPTDALAAQWQTFLAAIPWQIALQQYNTLGTHDTPRILTILNHDVALAKVAAVLLFTFPGVPGMYYGEEIGLINAGSFSSRQCMEWHPENWNHDLRDFYKRLIHLRRTSSALADGGFQILYAEGETIAFQRETLDEHLIVVARRGHDGLTTLPVRHAGLQDGMHLHDMLSGTTETIVNGHLPLNDLKAVDAQIWQVVSQA